MISHTLPHSLMCTECGKVSLLHSACAVEEEFNEKVEACVQYASGRRLQKRLCV